MPRSLLFKKLKLSEEQIDEISYPRTNDLPTPSNKDSETGIITTSVNDYDFSTHSTQSVRMSAKASKEGNIVTRSVRITRSSLKRITRSSLKQATNAKGMCDENQTLKDQTLVKSNDQDKNGQPTKKLREKCEVSSIVHLNGISDEDEIDDGKGDKDDLPPKSSRNHSIKWLKKGDKTVKIWVCGTCNKEFTHRYTLKRHLPIHTDERKYVCNVCGKAFRQASSMSRHKAVHSDDRPFVCDVCGKGFNRQSTLIVHRKTHVKEKIHTCEICDKGFHQKGNLKNHLFTHSGERPYKCDKCNSGFNQMSNLMCHKAHAHVEKPKFKCQLCDLEFSRKFSLRTHEEYKHGSNGKQFLVINEDINEDVMDAVKKSGRPLNSSRTITLPNGDKTIKFNEEIKEKLLQKVLNAKAKQKSKKTRSALATIDKDRYMKKVSPRVSKRKINNALDRKNGPVWESNAKAEQKYLKCSNNKNALGLLSNEERVSNPAGILIPRIQSTRVIEAERKGQTVFALLKPINGIPALVKVLNAQYDMHILVPTTAEDLKSGSRITVSSPGTNAKNNKAKAVQVKVPVVATIVHKTTASGGMVLEILPHAPLEDRIESDNKTDSMINS